jgi:hypothetical protein
LQAMYVVHHGKHRKFYGGKSENQISPGGYRFGYRNHGSGPGRRRRSFG